MVVVANETVMILPLPEGTPPSKDPVGLVGRIRLPGVKNIVEPIELERLDHGMDVVWHDTPTQQVVPFGVEVKQRVLDHRGNSGITQVTLADATIQHLADTLLLLDLTPVLWE
jgi:hypothetical protein